MSMTRQMLVIMIILTMVATSVPILGTFEASESTEDGYGYRYVDTEKPEPMLDFGYIDIRNDPDVIGWDTSNSRL